MSNAMRNVYRLSSAEFTVEEKGAKSGGTVDATAAFTAAIEDAYNAGGGTVTFNGIYLLSGNLTVRDNVHLRGPLGNPGEFLPGTSANYQAKAGTLIISVSATITTQDAASVSGAIVVRQGLALPFADATAATAGIAAFAGTAFTVGGADCSFRDLLILGFAQAVLSSGWERIYCTRVYGDCTNGISIGTAYDVPRLKDCHFWPWTTAHQTWTTNALLRRAGTAYRFQSVNDWMKVDSCFSYGYFRGFYATDVASMTFLSCGADNTSTSGVGDHANAFGFALDGTSHDVRWIACQAAANTVGYYNTATGVNNRLVECDSWANSGYCVHAGGTGSLTVSGGHFRDSPAGISVNDASQRLFVDHVRFSGMGVGGPIASTVSTTNVVVGTNNDYGDWPAGSAILDNANILAQTLASATTVNLPNKGRLFLITGTTAITTLGGGWVEREVVLKFASAGVAITDGGTIVLAGNYTSTVNGTLSLIYDGVNWTETARSAN